MVKSYIGRCQLFGGAFDLQECLKWVSFKQRYDDILAAVAEDRAASYERRERWAEAKALGIRSSFLPPADQDCTSEATDSPK